MSRFLDFTPVLPTNEKGHVALWQCCCVLFDLFRLFGSVVTEYLMGINIKDNKVTTEKQAKEIKGNW